MADGLLFYRIILGLLCCVQIANIFTRYSLNPTYKVSEYYMHNSIE